MCGAFSGFRSLPSPPFASTVYQCEGCLSYQGRGGSWLGCQVLPAISAVSILELVANSGSSRMSRAPNLHSLSESDKVVYLGWVLISLSIKDNEYQTQRNYRSTYFKSF